MDRRRHNAFTLVELLVVIAIIAVLVSVLLPAMQRARISAQRVVCMSNLHQCGISLIMYANDWKRFPVPCFEAGNYGVITYAPVMELLADTRAIAAGSVKYDVREGMQSYVKDWRIFFCPVLPPDFDPNAVPVIPAPNNLFLSCGYVALYGKALGLDNQYLLKPNGYWVSGDGKRRTALMADKFYFSYSQQLIEINHYERGKVTFQSYHGATPFGYTGYFSDAYLPGSTPYADFWAATLFSDGSVAGANTSGLTVIQAPTPAGPPFIDLYWLIDR